MNLRSFRVIHTILAALFIENSEIADLQLILAKTLVSVKEYGDGGALLLG